jgi:ParB family chromosome partitioning protein
MGGQAFKGPRLNGFFLDPDEIVLVGGNGPNDVPKTAELAHLYDKRVHDKPDEGMVRNMMVYGVIEAVKVQKIVSDDGENRAYVIDGRGRVIAAREANVRLRREGKEPILVPIVLKTGDPSKLFGILISANENRRDDTPIAKAEKIAQFMDMGRDEEAAANAYGITVANVRQLLKLLDLAPKVQTMIKKGTLSASAATQLVKLPHAEQVTKAEEVIASGVKPTARNISRSTGNRPVTPSKRVVQKLVALDKKPEIAEKYDSFWGALQFMLGQVTLEDVGLAEVVAELKAKKKKAKKGNAKGSKKGNSKQQTLPLDEKGKKSPAKTTSKTKTPPKKGPTIAKKKGSAKKDAAA